MQTRIVSILAVILAIAVFCSTSPLAAHPSPTCTPQPSPTCTPQLFTIPEASRSHEAANEVYAVPVTPGMYLLNFMFIYMANPDLAAYMPAYRAPIPQPVVDCLEQNPTGCPWADYRQYFDEQTFDNRHCFWPNDCQEDARWASLAPRKVRQRGQLNEPLGRRRADQIAHLLGIDAGMILTEAEYDCLIGTPPRDCERETIFRCIYNLTDSNGNALIPLSSYGLTVTEDGYVRSDCAPNAPCLEFNNLFGGALAKIAAECLFLEKLLRLEANPHFRQFAEVANACQVSGECACLIQATCAGNGR